MQKCLDKDNFTSQSTFVKCYVKVQVGVILGMSTNMRVIQEKQTNVLLKI